jgi:hypothetical protein
VWIDSDVEPVETANFLPKLMRSEFSLALTAIGSGLDDPDQTFYENYVCGAFPVGARPTRRFAPAGSSAGNAAAVLASSAQIAKGSLSSAAANSAK